MTRPSRRLLAVLTLALLLAGCGIPTDPAPRALDPALAPFSRAAPAVDPVGPGRIALYFVREGKAVLTIRPVRQSTPVPELLNLLLAGPTPSELAAGTSSLIPTTLTVQGIAVQSGVGVITLDGPAGQLSQPLAFAQIVATLTSPGRLSGVRFRVAGEDLGVPRGDLSLSTEPLDQTDYAALLATAGPGASPSSSAPPA
ncbi:MAG: GerMN domain-containing protein [Frankiales bacterium]|nr:GerMN domain-containing protein [Frankiales bacterium]